jgi:hypothetical protein
MDGAREKPLEWTRAALDQLDEQIEYVTAKELADPGRVGERIERALDLMKLTIVWGRHCFRVSSSG